MHTDFHTEVTTRMSPMADRRREVPLVGSTLTRVETPAGKGWPTREVFLCRNRRLRLLKSLAGEGVGAHAGPGKSPLSHSLREPAVISSTIPHAGVKQIKYALLQFILDMEQFIYYIEPMENNRLKLARVAKGLTQQELADQVDATRQTIGLIEKGKYNPSLNLCVKIARVLEKTLNDLFWEEP